MDDPILLTGKSAASYVWNTYKGNFIVRMEKSAHAFFIYEYKSVLFRSVTEC